MSSDAYGSIMTKSELIEIISAKQKHLPAKDVELAVKQLLEIMSDALATGERIEIRGFGSFSLHFRPPRQGRNPKTGEAVALAGKHVPHFKPGKDLRERVNDGAPQPIRDQSFSGRGHVLDLPLLSWGFVLVALVIGILAGHFGWGKRWPASLSKLHPDYLTGLDYLVTEQPDRALDMFLKLMDANAETIETHFALGSLYRRRGEVERAIRIHQNLLARKELASEHREQALLALAQDYLRAGVLDRAEGLFEQVSEVPRLRVSALDALRGVYERQHDWSQALGAYRQLARIKAAPARTVAAHYLCELATVAIERGDFENAHHWRRAAQAEAAP